MPASALMNVMVNAARKAGRSLARDFGEVERLQVGESADFFRQTLQLIAAQINCG